MREFVVLALILAMPFILFAVRMAPILTKAVMRQPPGRRWPVVKSIVTAFFKRRKSLDPPLTADEAAFRLPDNPVRTVPYEQWYRATHLVANASQVTELGSGMAASALDVDGSVVVTRYRDETTFDLAVRSPDGTFRAITGPEGVISAEPPWASIDRGSVAWWQVELSGKAAHLWIAVPGLPPRLLHTESIPKGKPLPFAPFGWVMVAGDKVAWTLIASSVGTIGVTALDGTTHHVGRTRFPTLHRDIAAENQGRRVAAVNVMEGDATTFGRVGELILDGPVPELRLLRSGAYAGASVCNGSVVGYWSKLRVLQMPGRLWVRMPSGCHASDVTSDGEWCASSVFRAPGSPYSDRNSADLFHLPTGARQRLCDGANGMPKLRAGRILWTWSDGDANWLKGTSSRVGELQAPSAATPVA